MKFCVAPTFWVELNLDVVLEVLQVVGLKFLFYKTCRYVLPQEDSLKNKDDCFIKGGDILLFELWKKNLPQLLYSLLYHNLLFSELLTRFAEALP